MTELHPLKGKKNGRCNRTACQAPLEDDANWSMHDYMTGGRLYYCTPCARRFTEADLQFREPIRCSIIDADASASTQENA